MECDVKQQKLTPRTQKCQKISNVDIKKKRGVRVKRYLQGNNKFKYTLFYS